MRYSHNYIAVTAHPSSVAISSAKLLRWNRCNTPETLASPASIAEKKVDYCGHRHGFTPDSIHLECPGSRKGRSHHNSLSLTEGGSEIVECQAVICWTSRV